MRNGVGAIIALWMGVGLTALAVANAGYFEYLNHAAGGVLPIREPKGSPDAKRVPWRVVAPSAAKPDGGADRPTEARANRQLRSWVRHVGWAQYPLIFGAGMFIVFGALRRPRQRATTIGAVTCIALLTPCLALAIHREYVMSVID